MQFNDWTTLFAYQCSVFSKTQRRHMEELADYQSFYKFAIAQSRERQNWIECDHYQGEMVWYEDKRPYYNVYPGIIPMLFRVRLDIPVEAVEPPAEALLIRLPTKDNPIAFDFESEIYHVKSVLACHAPTKTNDDFRLVLWLDIGEYGVNNQPVFSMRTFSIQGKKTIEQALSEKPKHQSAGVGVQVPESIHTQVTKLVCGLYLLAEDREVIEPDVLAEDRAKYDESHDQKYVDKAHRRGKVGWNVGMHIEKIPHYRKPHLALFWTGKGRTTPRIGLRKGTIVKRSVVGEIPTGYLDG